MSMDPAGSADDDVRLLLELLGLGVDRLAAIDGQDLEVRVGTEFPHLPRDLNGQFPGRDQAEAAERDGAVKHVQGRKPECCSLAGARLGLSQYILAADGQWDQLGLDDCRVLEPLVLDALEQGV